MTIPIDAILTAGSSHRFGFHIQNGINGGSGDIFDPDPPSAVGLSFMDSTGLFDLSGTWSIASDALPTVPNSPVPPMSLAVGAVPEPATMWLLTVALLLLGMTAARRRV